MSVTRRSIAVVTLIGAMVLVGCGADGGSDTESSPSRAATETSPEVLASANANCRRLLHDVRQLGKNVLKGGFPSTKALATQGFFAPGIRLVRQVAKRQQRLGRETENPSFHLYASLYDPIVVLAEQSLRATQAGDSAKSKELEDLLKGLDREQRQAARLAGLHACDVDFLDAMVNAAF